MSRPRRQLPVRVERPQGRRSQRLAGFDYAHVGAYFVTIVAHGRAPVFGSIEAGSMVLSPLGELAHTLWMAIPDRHSGVHIDAHVLMPDHAHGLILLTGSDDVVTEASGSTKRTTTLGAVVRAWKALVTLEGRRLGLVHGPLWQRGYHDRIVRDAEAFEQIRRYIIANPANWEP